MVVGRPVFLRAQTLSIIDLAHGAQPMASADQRYVIAFNGEIYNYLELRAELEKSGQDRKSVV
jgi:asparagine synthase (glutamine-hydrolysing)